MDPFVIKFVELPFVQSSVFVCFVFLDSVFLKNYGSMSTGFGSRLFLAGETKMVYDSSGEYFLVYMLGIIGVNCREYFVRLVKCNTSFSDGDSFFDLDG